MTPGSLLRQALARIQKKNRAFSRAALAKKLKVSSAFVSNLLNDKEKLPLERVADFGRALDMDTYAIEELKSSVIHQKLEKIDAGPRSSRGFKRKIEIEEFPEKFFSLLSNWKYVATLDLLTCDDFVQDTTWIASRLGISVRDAERAIDFLRSAGFLMEENGRWKKNKAYTRFPTKASHPSIRAFHREMLNLVRLQMRTAVTQEDFDRRQVLGACLAINRDKLPLAKQRLQEVLVEIAEILGEGPCTELYYLSNLMFPLTKD